MNRALRVFSYGHGGLGVGLLALAAGLLLLRADRFRGRPEALLPALYTLVGLAMITELCLTTVYLFSPAYIDHIEASVASGVHALLAGRPLYPPLDSYSFGGLLYGPLLAELNSLGYVLFRDSIAAKLVGWLAGWSAVAVLILQSRRGARAVASCAALSYALCFLVSFGADLTVDRSEPLLLLFAAGSMVIALEFKGLGAASVLGLLCGAAMGLKAHALLYIVPSVYVWGAGRTREEWGRRWKIMAACFCGAAATAVVLPFLPSNVCAEGFVRYLSLAAKHGLSLDLFARNGAFLLGLWAPIVLLNGGFRQLSLAGRPWLGFALTLLGCECVVLVVASKPGAGIHHFIPFLAPHVWLFQDACARSGSAVPGRAAVALSVAILGMITPTAQTFGSFAAFDLQLPAQRRQRDELLGFATRYPGGMLGVADNTSYALSNYRPWLTARGVTQTDYGAFMDLELSGLSDEPLRAAFARCTIPYVYLPKPGAPYEITSNYRDRPLFSDALRREFAIRYSQTAAGIYFDVFTCR